MPFPCFSYRSYLVEAPHSSTTVPSRFIDKHGFEPCLVEAVSRENSLAVYNIVTAKPYALGAEWRLVSVSFICFSLSLSFSGSRHRHTNRILYIYASVRGFEPESLRRTANRIPINGSRKVFDRVSCLPLMSRSVRYSFNG